jgi:hypothetical protein
VIRLLGWNGVRAFENGEVAIQEKDASPPERVKSEEQKEACAVRASSTNSCDFSRCACLSRTENNLSMLTYSDKKEHMIAHFSLAQSSKESFVFFQPVSRARRT